MVEVVVVASAFTLTGPPLVRAVLESCHLHTAGCETQVVYSDVSVLTLSYCRLYDKPVISLVVGVQPDV